VKIAIAGPGRSGTSLLVRLFDEWGFDTPRGGDHWHEEAQAGFESRIGAGSLHEVDKDPWAFEYIGRLDPEVLGSYDAFIVPLRDRHDAAISRSVQERWFRARHVDSDGWQWNSWGPVPGGAVADTSVPAIEATLAKGLWDVLEAASRAGLSPIVLHFPRFVEDFDYVWAQLGHLIGDRQSPESARAAWERVVDRSKVRVEAGDESTVEVRELRTLVELMRRENASLRAALTEREAPRRDA
jgi:hypothetical protein